VNKNYLIIAGACVAFAIAAYAEDIAAVIIVIVGAAIYWKLHKIEAKLNKLLARSRNQRRQDALGPSKEQDGL